MQRCELLPHLLGDAQEVAALNPKQTIFEIIGRPLQFYGGVTGKAKRDKVVEQGPTDEVLAPPFHPYTRLLITSVPELRIGWLEDTMQKCEMAVGIARGVEITAVGILAKCPVLSVK